MVDAHHPHRPGVGRDSPHEIYRQLDVLEEPKAEPSIPMSQLPDKLKEKGANLSTDPEAYLNSYLGYKMEPNKDPEADWRLDGWSAPPAARPSSTAI